MRTSLTVATPTQPTPFFVNKALSEDRQSHTHAFTYCLGCFGSARQMGFKKQKNAHRLALHKKFAYSCSEFSTKLVLGA